MSTSNDWLFGNTDARISHRKTESFFADVIARAHEWDLSTGTVVSIYGAGGEGKSVFIRELRELCKNRLPSDLWSTVYIDFFKEKSSPIEDLRSMFEAFAAAGIFCPRFDVAYHSYQHPGNMAQASAGYLQDCEDYIEDTAILSEVSEPMNTFLGVTSIACDLTGLIPGVSTIKDAVELYFDKRDKLKRNREREAAEQLWRDYANYDRRSLIACMPRLLLEDFTEAIDQMSRRTTPCRPVVIVDTFEHLLVEDAAGALSSIGELIQRLSHVPNTLWVVAGRHSLLGKGWDNVVHYPIELVDLDEDGTREILCAEGITDLQLVHDIYEFSGGLPLFIALCVDALRNLPAENLRLSFEGLVQTHKTREDLLRHFVVDLDDDMELAVYAMSYLHEWDEELLADLLAMDGLMDGDMADLVVEDAARLSFITTRGDRYQMHERIAAMLRSMRPETRPMKTAFRKLFRNMSKQLESVKDDKTLRAEDARHLSLVYSRGLWELSKHGRTVFGRMDADELFNLRCDYVEELKWARLFDSAIATIDEMLPMYEGQFEKEIRLRLMRSANLTQLWLIRDDIECHYESMRIERDVLDRIEEAGVESYPQLYAMTRNSLGLSVFRIAKTLADIEESLGYLRPNYDATRGKPVSEMSTSDIFRMNNYGLANLKAAELCGDSNRATLFLQEALEAFARAVAAREEVDGPLNNFTLRYMVNKGIALQHLGRLQEARECLELVNTRFEEAKYWRGRSDWLYNRYHHAILLELEAEKLSAAGDSAGALKTLSEAYAEHRDVLHDRIRYNDGAQAVSKSRSHVNECEGRMNELSSE